MSKLFVGIVVGAALGAGGYWALSSGALESGFTGMFPEPAAQKQGNKLKSPPNGTYCAQVITSARDPETGKIREFPTSCSVPPGWEVIENDIPELDLEIQ
ncbi:MAG: hypothetical protein AAB923_00955 [Patescibacteria group bacterium]